MPPPSPTGNHFVVCGDSQLAYRIALELTSRYDVSVTVILPSLAVNHGPEIGALPGVTVLERPALTSETFTEAGLESARALALVAQNDIGNFHAGLRAVELNRGLRLVLAVFNRRLGEHIRGFFPDCTVLSGSAMAAPAFVAAALGEPAPSHVRVSGRTLYVARATDVPSGHIVCGLEVPASAPGTARLLAPETVSFTPDDLVLAVADGTPRDALATKRHPLRSGARVARVARRLVWNRFGLLFAILFSVVLAGFGLNLFAGYSLSNTVYLTFMDLTGSALTNPRLGGTEKVAQVILTGDGMAMLPVVTALIVGARLTGSLRGEPRPRGGHVIVAGLGNVGTRIVGQLHDLGFPVACIDRDPRARGLQMARRYRLPVVIGDAYQEQTLRAAGLDTAIALVSVTGSDITNLEAALQARALREDLRLVVSLYDDDLAQRVQQTVGNIVSRSISYMAAPAFAAAMLEHQVLTTISVGRHVLLIADVRVEPGAAIVGQALTGLEENGQVRVLALHIRDARGLLGLDWAPHRGYLLAAGDRLIVVATRAGLGGVLAGNRPVLL
ncbi:MAG TPA: NAD-binding protein [Trebonia sp.]|nr:NAD-binding protein [Trebonia sp.]